MASPISREPSQTPSHRSRSFFGRSSVPDAFEPFANDEGDEDKSRPTRWGMGILNDTITVEVPGSVLLLTGDHNQPLGLRNAPARTSASSLPQSIIAAYTQHRSRQARLAEGKKKTKDGAIILEPQPDDSHNDPLNWPSLKRDAALLSLGLYCMVGGGVTPILAAGFSNVAATYHVTSPKVALTTGLYMMGLGVGSVFASPTAILYGKRPVYLVGALLFICTSIWCAVSPTYNSLLLARIFQGMAVSPVECLPSATIAEIFFLHERAYRIGIYTLLLLGGKNLVPLVSAAIIQSLSWRWVFWILAMVVGFCWVLLFLFVPETFWDRTPVPKIRKTFQDPSRHSFFSHRKQSYIPEEPTNEARPENSEAPMLDKTTTSASAPQARRGSQVQREQNSAARRLHVGFAADENDSNQKSDDQKTSEAESPKKTSLGGSPVTDNADVERGSSGYLNAADVQGDPTDTVVGSPPPTEGPASELYTSRLQQGPRLTFVQQLKPYNGRLHNDKWLRVAFRPFILYAYPAVLWSSIVYACSIGWLIVLSESVALVYRNRTTYGFSALSTGLIYISPFIGGILGTAVAGKASDIIVRAMARRNGGLYEPEFRLVMAVPIAITTVIGLMGFGWSAQVHDKWIVPTIFFGVISFGCSLGSTTAITFCVDSYRQYAGEALVTLNFSKNVFHGLMFSLFFTKWLESDGSKKVFIWVGVIQLILMTFTIPMYIFGKRARMWTVRKNFMEKF